MRFLIVFSFLLLACSSPPRVSEGGGTGRGGGDGSVGVDTSSSSDGSTSIDGGSMSFDMGMTVSDTGPGGFDPDQCRACRENDESCVYSINCFPGSICNTPDDILYDDMEMLNVCMQVYCSADSDCKPPKICDPSDEMCKRP